MIRKALERRGVISFKLISFTEFTNAEFTNTEFDMFSDSKLQKLLLNVIKSSIVIGRS